MIKKTLTFVLATFLFFNILFSSTASIADGKEPDSKAKMASVVEIEWTNIETSTLPIKPGQGYREYDFNLKYSIVKEPALRNLLYPLLLKGKKIDIKFTIEDKPDWCEVMLFTDTITTEISEEIQVHSSKIIVSVNNNAPIYERGMVKINISIPAVKGPFGLITFIDSFTQSFSVDVTAGYQGLLTAEYIQGNYIEISPNKAKTIPIEITNKGNGQTTVFVELRGPISKSLNINYPEEIELDIDETKSLELIVTANNDFDEQDIEIRLIPSYSLEKGKVGNTLNLRLNLKNDGSYVQEGLYIIFLLIFLIVLIISGFVVFRMMKKRK
jgi:hypothetical protein